MNEKDYSFTSKDGCKYSIDCPLRPRSGIPYCCGHCAKARRDYVNDRNRHLWTDKHGFHAPGGCRLSREDMPEECREYDCRNYVFNAFLYYENGVWQALSGIELEEDEIGAIAKAITATFQLWREERKRRENGQNNS